MMSSLRRLTGAAALLGIFALGGCGSDDGAAPPPSAARPAAPQEAAAVAERAGPKPAAPATPDQAAEDLDRQIRDLSRGPMTNAGMDQIVEGIDKLDRSAGAPAPAPGSIRPPDAPAPRTPRIYIRPQRRNRVQ